MAMVPGCHRVWTNDSDSLRADVGSERRVTLELRSGVFRSPISNAHSMLHQNCYIRGFTLQHCNASAEQPNPSDRLQVENMVNYTLSDQVTMSKVFSHFDRYFKSRLPCWINSLSLGGRYLANPKLHFWTEYSE
jgi:hypothetical protein